MTVPQLIVVAFTVLVMGLGTTRGCLWIWEWLRCGI
jgi:hypothetical protein